MKIVLRHKSTGRYYRAPQDWVRRSDNALAFDHLIEALEFLHSHQLAQAQTVFRLAPYLMPLLKEQEEALLAEWTQSNASRWYAVRVSKPVRN